MNAPPARTCPVIERRRAVRLSAAAALVAIGFVALWAALSSPVAGPHARPELVPWIALLFATVAAPSAYAWLHGRLDALHPLTFAGLLYFVPDFVVGGLVLAAGWSQPYFMAFIDTPGYSLALTVLYLALGFAALTFGCALPAAGRAGVTLDARLPHLNWPAERLFAPATLLLLAGLGFTSLAYDSGVIGYQNSGPASAWAASWHFGSLCLPLGTFLICAAAFRTRDGGWARRVAFVSLAASVLLRALLAGSRATLLHALVAAGCAYVAARRPFTARGLLRFGLLVAAGVVLGMAYGSTFRAVKGSEARVSLGTQAGYAAVAVQQLAQRTPRAQLAFVGQRLAERLEQLSSVAVIVANADRLRDEERRLGLHDNILQAAKTSLVPRFLWPDKPAVSPPRAFAALYFRYGGNSFVLSPVGDLLRNFGPWGIVGGMALLGFVLRVLQAALVGDERLPSLGRAGLYYLLLSSVSYEDTYAVLLPTLLRVGLVGALAAGGVSLWLWAASRARGAAPAP